MILNVSPLKSKLRNWGYTVKIKNLREGRIALCWENPIAYEQMPLKLVVYTEISPFKEKNLGKTAKGCTSCNANSNKRTASC